MTIRDKRQVATSIILCAFLLLFQGFQWNRLSAQSEHEAKPVSELEKAITKFVKMEVNFGATTGLVVGAIDNDESTVLGFGETHKGNSTSPDSNTIFEIGACTKIFTASLVAILQQQGKLNYEDQVAIHFKGSKLHPYFENKDITILDLLTHHSGFARSPKDFGLKRDDHNPFEEVTYQVFMNDLKDFENVPRQRRKYVYSHTNYFWLSILIEQITQQPFETILQKQLLDPLQLHHTFYNVPPAFQSRMATGYNDQGDSTSIWNIDILKGAMGLKSTASDMLRLLKAQIISTDDTLITILQSMHDYSTDTHLKKVEVGIGWHHIGTRRKYMPFLGHRGKTDGQQVHIYFLKETGTAVVTLSNSIQDLDGAGVYILKMINYNWKRNAN